MHKKIIEYLTLSYFGGSTYVLLEVLFRGYSHWSMFLLGALCFVLIGLINEKIPWEIPIEVQAVIGSVIITVLEFITGVIVNIFFGWHVWDYSDLPFNILGQICIPFSLIWFVLSFVIIISDDYYRYFVFKEDKPHYNSILLRREFK